MTATLLHRLPVGGAQRPRLVAARLDPWLVGGAGIVLWVLMVRPFGVVPVSMPVLTGPIQWGLLALVGTHFGISYHLAYGQGREIVNQRRGLLVGVPVLLGALSVVACAAVVVGSDALGRTIVRLLLASVFTLTGWHYIKQSYGVTRLSASMHDLRIGPRAAMVLRYGLYPLWFFDAAVVWTVGFRPYRFGFEGGLNVLPRITIGLLAVAVMVSAVATVGCFVYLGLLWRRMPPPTVWTPIVVGFLWLTWRPDHVSAILVLGALHAVQYLACAHRAEVAWGRERGETRLATWWASVFGAGLATGMLLSYWLPMWLGSATGATVLGLFPAALLFAFFNLHHYAVDAAIWRSRDGHVQRIVRHSRRTASAGSGLP